MFVLIGIGALPLAVTCGVCIYFAIAKPEKLQSEDYQLRREAMMLVRQKGGRLKVDAVSLERIARPESVSKAGEKHATKGDTQ